MGGLLQPVDDILGTDLTGKKSRDAAVGAQMHATNQANELQREQIGVQKEIYDQQRKDVEPWRQTGLRALGSIQSQMPELNRSFGMSDFQKDPGYQFRMNEANKAIERSAAARGGLGSGRTLKELTRFNQDYASNEYQNAYNRYNQDRNQVFNRYASMAGLGQTANSQLAQGSQNYGATMGNIANNMSANYMGLGNAIGSAHLAQSNQQNNLLGQGLTAGALYFSDERLKTNIRPISKDDLQELKAAIKPYVFNYSNPEHGEGDWIGVMAQDLEKTKLGKLLVEENEKGQKQINANKVASLFLATLAEG